MNTVSETSGVVLVLLAVFFWATVGIGVQLVPETETLTPEILALARTAIGGLVILAIVVCLRGFASLRMPKSTAMHLLGFAVSNAVFQIGLFRCFEMLGVTVTAFLTGCLPPVMVALRDCLNRTGSLKSRNLLALGLAATGLAFIAAAGEAGPDAMTWRAGLAVAVLTSAAFVMMSATALELGRRVDPFLGAGMGLTLSGAVLLAVVLVHCSVTSGPIAASLSHPQFLGLGLYLGVIPTALAFTLYFKGMARCRSTLVGLIASMARPAFAAILAVTILSDELTPAVLAGCTVVMLAMIVLMQGERKQVRRAAPPASVGVPSE